MTTPGLGGAHYALGPAVAVLAVLVLLLLCRWVFGTGHRTSSPLRVVRLPEPGVSVDYGLLVPVAVRWDRDDADLARRQLASHGIRGTVVTTSSGHEVRVFSSDADRARTLV